MCATLCASLLHPSLARSCYWDPDTPPARCVSVNRRLLLEGNRTSAGAAVDTTNTPDGNGAAADDQQPNAAARKLYVMLPADCPLPCSEIGDCSDCANAGCFWDFATFSCHANAPSAYVISSSRYCYNTDYCSLFGGANCSACTHASNALERV